MIKAVGRPRTHPAEHTHEISSGPGELRTKGRRMTRQRQLIWEALTADPDGHLSADDVVERVSVQPPPMNPSTVYRTLELLVEEGLLLRTDLGGHRAYYEPAREHRHHHLVCESCGAVRHLHDEELGDLRERISRGSGFELGEREIAFFGRCSACRDADASG
jgi:Fur family ferric uptake transcriptional regulator